MSAPIQPPPSFLNNYFTLNVDQSSCSALTCSIMEIALKILSYCTLVVPLFVWIAKCLSPSSLEPFVSAIKAYLSNTPLQAMHLISHPDNRPMVFALDSHPNTHIIVYSLSSPTCIPEEYSLIRKAKAICFEKNLTHLMIPEVSPYIRFIHNNLHYALFTKTVPSSAFPDPISYEDYRIRHAEEFFPYLQELKTLVSELDTATISPDTTFPVPSTQGEPFKLFCNCWESTLRPRTLENIILGRPYHDGEGLLSLCGSQSQLNHFWGAPHNRKNRYLNRILTVNEWYSRYDALGSTPNTAIPDLPSDLQDNNELQQFRADLNSQLLQNATASPNRSPRSIRTLYKFPSDVPTLTTWIRHLSALKERHLIFAFSEIPSPDGAPAAPHLVIQP